MRTAQVMFANAVGMYVLAGTQLYNYLLDIDDVGKDDLVIVETPSGEYKVVKVVAVHDSISPKATKEIVAKLDVTAYEAKVAQRERRKAILAELKLLERQEDEMERYRRLAATSGKAKDLLAELETL